MLYNIYVNILLIMKEDKKTKDPLSRYVDVTEGFSSRKLKFAEWYVSHKILLHKIGMGVLIGWCVLSVGFSFSYWFYYFSYGYFQDQRIEVEVTNSFVNYENLQPLYEAKQIQISNISVYNSVSELYDFVGQATNPNTTWAAIVTYKFKYFGGETPSVETILLPLEKRPIAYLGLEMDKYPSNPTLVIEEIDWKRIDPHLIENPRAFADERLMFSFENFHFTRASRSTGVLNHLIEFDIFNDSAYSYWEPSFYVEMISGGQTVGITYIVLDKFRTGDEEHVDFQSLVDSLDVHDIKIWPLINVFDNRVYMEVGE